MDNQTPTIPQQPVQQPVTQPAAAPVENDDSELSLTELWYLCIGRWPWFVLSVLLCLGVATLKLLRTQKTYTQHMEVMIKSDSRDYSGGTMGDFADLGLFQSNSNVNNELIAIMSPALSLEVVNEMELNIRYSEPGFFKDRTLYGQSLPVKVVFCDIDNEGYAAFHISLKEDGSFTLGDFDGIDLEDEAKGTIVEGKLSQDTIQSPVGRLVVMNGMGYGSLMGERTIDVVHIPASNAAGAVQGGLSAQVANKQATVITLTYVDVNRFRAADVLNTLIACYNRNWVNDKNQVATSTSQFINDRLAVIEKELGSVDTDISQYQSQNLISDVKAANQMYMAQANQASQQAVQLNNQLYMAKYLREYVSSDANKYQLLPANSGVEDRTIENLISTYNAKQLQRNSLVANSSVNNPVVLDLDKELTEMRNNLIRSIDNQITALNTQIRSTRQTEAQSNAQMASNPTRQKYLLSVEANLIQKENRQIVSRIPVRIVFVRNRAKRKDWIALISTDMDISEEEIIRRYGVRWNIEVYFKTCKQHLKLLKESNSPSFDAFTCHLTIVCVRYMILAVNQRAASGDRTLGELFWFMTAEAAEISFTKTLVLILEALLDTVREFFAVSDEQMQAFTHSFLAKLPQHLRSALGISQPPVAA